MTARGGNLLASVIAGSGLAHCLFIFAWPTWAGWAESSAWSFWPPLVVLAVVLVAVFVAVPGAVSAQASLVARQPWILPLLLSFAWAWLHLQQVLDDRLESDLAGVVMGVDGRIDGLPERYDAYTRFRFRPSAAAQGLPDTLLVYWYRNATERAAPDLAVPELATGQRWHLELQLKPPWGRVNFTGDDRERWLFAERIGGLATVRRGTLAQSMETRPGWFHSQRQIIREFLLAQVADSRIQDSRAWGVLVALAIADRSALTEDVRRMLAATGTAHLLAISGLHVGLAAIGGFWLCRAVLLMLPLPSVQAHSHRLALASSLLAAWIYAGLAGFGTSTVRALVMLAAGVAALLIARAVHPLQAFLLALAAVLVLDPLAPLSAGFWLSFGAVATLLFLFAFRRPGLRGFWPSLLTAQAGISLGLLPLSAFWFQSASPSGLLANLLAIPWVSFAVVPPVLAGLVALPLSGTVSGLLFTVAAGATQLLLVVLAYLAELPGASVPLRQPGALVTAMALGGAMLLLLPRGVPHRWLGLALLLPLLLPASAPAPGSTEMLVLDVGQGSAVLIGRSDQLMLYDSGPGVGSDFDLVDSVIAPAVRQMGFREPGRIIISHGDSDHAGGLQTLRTIYPRTPMYASLRHPLPGVQHCDDTLQWQQGGMKFHGLHPSPYLPYQGNDSSCVISIQAPGARILLAGDISAAIEGRLVGRSLGPHELLLAAHHGSNSSSTTPFLQHTAPRVAVATTGLGNRFGFPRPEVLARFASLGTPLWSTGDCGAVRVRALDNGTISSSSARRARQAPWRWPAASFCP